MSSNKKSHPPVSRTPVTSRTTSRLSDQLCFALYSATNAMTRTYRPFLHELGLTYPQYLVLLVLWEKKECRLGEIAEGLRLATHAVSPIIDRLEESGLVRRNVDEEDARAVRVELTKKGAKMESDAAAVQDAVRLRTDLDPAAVARLRADLHELVDHLLEG